MCKSLIPVLYATQLAAAVTLDRRINGQGRWLATETDETIPAVSWEKKMHEEQIWTLTMYILSRSGNHTELHVLRMVKLFKPVETSRLCVVHDQYSACRMHFAVLLPSDVTLETLSSQPFINSVLPNC